ncbi:MAG: molybdopterin-synthase adenylyltransferase MoeB [Thermoanaerobaculia bacterium]
MSFSPEQLRRYGRQMVMPELGAEGQERLRGGSVLVVGVGGLGSPAALYLAAAGIGRLGVVEDDRVDASNLHRQVLYGTADVGRPKIEAALERLHDLNPDVDLVPFPERLRADNARRLVAGFDVVVDGSDNFATRYLVNDACVLEGKPDVFGAVLRFEGQLSVFWAAEGPCYRCLFPEPPPAGLVPSCAEAGVLGVLPGVVGGLQAAEAIKLVTGIGEPLTGRLLLFDGMATRFREVEVPKAPTCPACSPGAGDFELVEYADHCSEGGTMTEELPLAIDVAELARRREAAEELVLIDVRTPMESSLARIEGGTLIPLQELASRADEIPADREVVLYCHHGPRSDRAALFCANAVSRRSLRERHRRLEPPGRPHGSPLLGGAGRRPPCRVVAVAAAPSSCCAVPPSPCGAWLTGHRLRSLDWVARWPPAAPWVERFRATFGEPQRRGPWPLPRMDPPSSSCRRARRPTTPGPGSGFAKGRRSTGRRRRARPSGRQEATANLEVIERDGEWYRVRARGRGAGKAWVRLAGGGGEAAPSPGVVEPAAPCSAVAPDAGTVTAALSRMGSAARRVPCGGYTLVTDAELATWIGLCERVVSPLDEAYERALGVAPIGAPAEAIFLFADATAFRSFAAEVSGVRSGYAGHARAARGYLALPAGPVGPTVRTLVHELAHLVSRRALGPALPRWLSEGIADLLGDEATPAGLGTVRGSLGAEGEMQRLQAAYGGRLAGSVERLVRLGPEEFDAALPSYDY